jgi:hypothetical protein
MLYRFCTYADCRSGMSFSPAAAAAPRPVRAQGATAMLVCHSKAAPCLLHVATLWSTSWTASTTSEPLGILFVGWWPCIALLLAFVALPLPQQLLRQQVSQQNAVQNSVPCRGVSLSSNSSRSSISHACSPTVFCACSPHSRQWCAGAIHIKCLLASECCVSTHTNCNFVVNVLDGLYNNK